jgi:hypothetical protein
MVSSQAAQHVPAGADPVVHLVPDQKEYFHGDVLLQ